MSLISDQPELEAARSSEWPKVRAAHLEKEPRCMLCNGDKVLNVHHVIPFHLRPELELDPTNLITLCENKGDGVNCHLAVGHLGSFKSFNETVVEDAKYLNKRLRNRP